MSSSRRRLSRVSTLLAMLALIGVASSTTSRTAESQQTRTAPRPKPRPARGHKGDGGAEVAASESTRAEKDAGVTQKTIDGGTKVFRFGEGCEIEGRLKNPQLVFFLRRVRAEFAAGDLGHRSFMRELGETRHDPNF